MAMTFKSVQEMFAYDGSADVVEVARPSNGILRSVSNAEMKMNHKRAKKTIFIPENMVPFQIKLDTKIWKASGRAMCSLCNFNIWGGPYFNGITDLDMVSCDQMFPYAEMHRDPTMRANYSDRAKAMFLQSAQRVTVAAGYIHDCQGGVTVSKTTDVTLCGMLFDKWGGPTTPVVHPDMIGLVGGGSLRCHLVDSAVYGYPRIVVQGPTAHKDLLLNNLWLASNLGAPLQFAPSVPAPNGNMTGQLKNLQIWFTIAGKQPYRMDAGQFAYVPGQYYKGDKRICVTEKNVKILANPPTGEPPYMSWWSQDPLQLAKDLRNA
jgi:hypothetical protein